MYGQCDYNGNRKSIANGNGEYSSANLRGTISNTHCEWRELIYMVTCSGTERNNGCNGFGEPGFINNLYTYRNRCEW